MAGKAHGNGDRRGDNTICGLGDRLRRLTAGICLITQTIFPVMAAAPTHINPAHSDTAASLILPNVKTIPYTLGALESPPTVAARFGITVDELRRLNQFRTFARGFDNVRQGDEIDVPLINSNSPEARNLKAMQMERDGKDPQMQVAEMAQQSGTLLARDMDSEQAASMARGWVASSASAQATDWLSRWGTARVSLGVDEDFSLKSSSFEFLHPWYETPYNLVFSQHTLHRTDDRTQTNHGIGWRRPSARKRRRPLPAFHSGSSAERPGGATARHCGAPPGRNPPRAPPGAPAWSPVRAPPAPAPAGPPRCR